MDGSIDSLLSHYAAGVDPNAPVADSARDFLLRYGATHTIGHSARVAAAAAELALRVGEDPQAAATAGWLHDISTIIPNDQRITHAESWGVPVLAEERQVPMIIHQKLSVVLAERVFAISNPAILQAIGCHTTLRSGASMLDQVVFLADKIKWDGQGEPPYAVGLQAALAESVPAATRWFLSYLWNRRHELKVIHPWLIDAYTELVQAANTTGA